MIVIPRMPHLILMILMNTASHRESFLWPVRKQKSGKLKPSNSASSCKPLPLGEATVTLAVVHRVPRKTENQQALLALDLLLVAVPARSFLLFEGPGEEANELPSINKEMYFRLLLMLLLLQVVVVRQSALVDHVCVRPRYTE